MLTIRILVTACFLSVVLYGQERFRITGIVTDTEGNPLEGAEITIPEYSSAPPARADTVGRFEVPNLSAGRYAVRATLTGFRPQTQYVELSERRPTQRIKFALRVGVLIEGLAVLPEPRDALRQSAAVAHIRLEGLAPPLPCSELIIVSAVHEATVLNILQGKLPAKIQVLQDSAGTCLDGSQTVVGLNSVLATGSEYVVFLDRAGTRFDGLGNKGYKFRVSDGLVMTRGYFGLPETMTLDEFRAALRRLRR